MQGLKYLLLEIVIWRLRTLCWARRGGAACESPVGSTNITNFTTLRDSSTIKNHKRHGQVFQKIDERLACLNGFVLMVVTI